MGTRFLVRRLIWLVVVLWGVATIAFSLVYILPGDPVVAIAGPRVSTAAVKALREKWGLDQPIHVQYYIYMARLLHGDMGRSWQFRVAVLPAIVHRLPPTGILAASGLLLGLVLGIPIGIISAVLQYSWADRAVMLTSLAAVTFPAFIQGLLFIFVFAYLLELLPMGGYGGLRHLILPAGTLGIRSAAWYGRMLRSTMLDILGEEYIRTARSKGLGEHLVIGRHALRNAVGPIVSMIGADFGYYMGGVLVVEKVFSWPGIGMQAWNAVALRDVPMIMGTVLVAAFFVVLANLVVDVAQFFVDPRRRR